MPRNVRVLDHLLHYVEFQVGKRIPGKSYRQMGISLGERIDNWEFEIDIMLQIYLMSLSVYVTDKSLSLIGKDNMTLPYFGKIIEVLKPWFQMDSLSKVHTNHVLEVLSYAECGLAAVCTHRKKYKLSEDHCQLAISYARGCDEGEVKTTRLFGALTCYSKLQGFQGDYTEALILAEEAYNVVAMIYNPVHPQVQEAANSLIECLICKEDLYNAERYSRMTLDNLRDPANNMDQEGETVARGYYNSGNVIYRQKGDLMRAEMLVRESLRIFTLLYGSDHTYVGHSVGLLASILKDQGNLGDEVKELLERSLAIHIKNDGPEGMNTAIRYISLSSFHDQLARTDVSANKRKEHLTLSLSFTKEALRIRTKVTSTHVFLDCVYIFSFTYMQRTDFCYPT
jgi:tetratricopeptide (TPR) repeat protein